MRAGVKVRSGRRRMSRLDWNFLWVFGAMVFASLARAATPTNRLTSAVLVEAERCLDAAGTPGIAIGGSPPSAIVSFRPDTGASGGGFVTPTALPVGGSSVVTKPTEVGTEVAIAAAGLWYGY